MVSDRAVKQFLDIAEGALDVCDACRAAPEMASYRCCVGALNDAIESTLRANPEAHFVAYRSFPDGSVSGSACLLDLEHVFSLPVVAELVKGAPPSWSWLCKRVWDSSCVDEDPGVAWVRDGRILFSGEKDEKELCLVLYEGTGGHELTRIWDKTDVRKKIRDLLEDGVSGCSIQVWTNEVPLHIYTNIDIGDDKDTHG
jgi:hypothetical protein